MATNRTIIDNEELWRIRKKVVRTYFEIQSQESLGDTEEIDDNHFLDNRRFKHENTIPGRSHE
jgi:hypothetical protein